MSPHTDSLADDNGAAHDRPAARRPSAQPPPRRHPVMTSPPEHLVKVARAENLPQAELLQQRLDDEGVPSVLRRSAGSDVPDFLAAGPRDVLVPASSAALAREVLGEPDPDDEHTVQVSVQPGRPWYHPRPRPRRRSDVMGLSGIWWALIWLVVIVLAFFPLPWWW